MRDLYHLAKAVYAGDLTAAQGVLDHMRHREFDVLRAKLAVGRAPAAEPVPVDTEVQARLDKLMQPVEDEMRQKGAALALTAAWWTQTGRH